MALLTTPQPPHRPCLPPNAQRPRPSAPPWAVHPPGRRPPPSLPVSPPGGWEFTRGVGTKRQQKGWISRSKKGDFSRKWALNGIWNGILWDLSKKNDALTGFNG